MPARPEEYDTAARGALYHIDRQPVRTVAHGRPESTRRSYAQDWVSWTEFCAASEVPVLAVTPGTLVMYVEWLWTQPPSRGRAHEEGDGVNGTGTTPNR
ncbi:hypothetical protein [Streptomyces sp. NPDC002078]